MRVLIVEDDRSTAASLHRGLAEAGLAVDLVENGEQAVAAAMTTAFDVIVLDVMLPGELDGFAVCARLRRLRVPSCVLMLTARDRIDDRVRGLEAGADDYLVKPFAFRELLARVRALARRQVEDRANLLVAGELALDVAAKRATVRGVPLILTAKEFAILEFFLHHPGQVLSRSQIEEHVWSYSFDGTSNLVEVYIARIRRKLADNGLPDPLATLRGSGYRFDSDRLWSHSSAAPASG